LLASTVRLGASGVAAIAGMASARLRMDRRATRRLRFFKMIVLDLELAVSGRHSGCFSSDVRPPCWLFYRAYG
jgi:hypothetical protein